MKILKNTVLSFLVVLLVISPFLAIIAFAFSSPAQYENSFVSALKDKRERLLDIESPKVVIIGGSSVAFGIDSALIEKYTEMPVVNFGLYAALGTKLMLDLSRDGIGEGDLVIIAPELDSQTLSLYFNSEATLEAFDGDMALISELRGDDFFSALGGMWHFAASKMKYMREGDVPNPLGVYNSKNFNEYGDVDYERAENIMPLYFDPTLRISPNPDIVSEDFLEYLNEYIAFCKGRGAKVAFSFSPMNELALAEGVTDESLAAFSDYLEDRLDCDVISKIEHRVYSPGYFYDTNFHLNDSGVRLHTVNLAYDILLELGIPKYIDENIPEPPPLKDIEVLAPEYDENSLFFKYEKMANGAYMIVGLSEEGMNSEELTVPKSYNGYKVAALGEAALSGGIVKRLIITEDTNIRNFLSGSFDGASHLSELVIRYMNAEDILPPPSFSGVSDSFKVHVPKDSSYDLDYYWSDRNLIFVKDQ